MTTSFLFAVGDVTAQQLVDKKGLEKHDLARTGRMALYGGGTQHALFHTYFTVHPSIEMLHTNRTKPHNSRLRPRSSDLVQVPLAARHPAVAKRDHPGPRGVRPGHLCPDLHWGVSEQHGGAGGLVAQGEAGEELFGGAPYQLDDLAVCADGQLQARSAAPSVAVCERH